MDPERWRIVKHVFDAVVEASPGDRAAVLASRCDHDPSLRAEVDAPLRADDAAEGFMDRSSVLLTSPNVIECPADAMLGRRIGPYKIDREIGRGGMGAVYLAERADGMFEQRVAIKLVRPGLDAAPIVRRFGKERQILARLEHQNIARLFDGGTTDDGLPYFVMEYVEGSAIDKYCDRKELSIDARLRLFRTVCAAMQYAHEHQVIHLDLKPTNVLVTTDGIVKLLDFGIAKLLPTEPVTEQTATGISALTPEYASPEQIRGGSVSTATDVYALGVVLYRLLTGRGPYQPQTKTGFELARAICDQDPEPPNINADVDSIVLQALEKDPRSRYASASAFEEDIRRYFERRPVCARRWTVAYRTAKFMRRNKPLAPVLAAALLFAIAVLILGRMGVLRINGGAAGLQPAFRSVAVLPLQNLSPDREQDYLADGMTDALITNLSKIGTLRVISRASVMPYKGTSKGMRAIARELGVDGVIEGSVQRSSNRVRITAQLIDAVHDRHLWADSYERELDDVLRLESDVALAVVRQIRANLEPREEAALTLSRRVNPKAQEAYLRGRYYWHEWNEPSLRKSIEYFNRALEEDPRYAPAWAGLSDAYDLLGVFDMWPTQDALPKAKLAAMKALEIDPTLCDAYVSLAGVHIHLEWAWADAERALQRALTLEPNHALAHQVYAYYHLALNHFDDALREARKARELDPLEMSTNASLAYILQRAGQLNEARRELQHLIELHPTNAAPYRMLAEIDERQERYMEAVDEWRTALRLAGQDQVGASIAREYEIAGFHAAREQYLHRMLAQSLATSQTVYVSPYSIASIYARLGERSAALEWLDKAFRIRAEDMPFLRGDPDFANLHHEPRVQAIIAQMNLPR